MLERLQPDQIDFLRAFGHTLARQPVTETEWQQYRCEYFVEDDDGEPHLDFSGWLVPPSRRWFASGCTRSGPCGWVSFIQYNPVGLLLRECLMCGAGAVLPQMYPARAEAVA
jgi:hypothetical protein